MSEEPKIFTGFTFNKTTNQIIPFFDPINPEEVRLLSEKRIIICHSCELFTNQGACSFCGCNMTYKSQLLYPLDDEGKAFFYVDLSGKPTHVCNLKKW